jgi:predicted oxidoreductase
MQYVTLNPDGLRCSRLVWGVMNWGAWGSQFDTQAMLSLIEQGLELGLTTFDHADIYGHYTTEAEFGAALKLNPALRPQLQLVTKCGIHLVTPNRPENVLKSYETGKAHIIASAERSLQNLHTDYLDLLLIHRPSPLMNPDEIAEAFEQLKKAGKVRHFGVSNFTPAQYALLQSRTELVSNQVEASLFHLDSLFDGTFDQAIQHRSRPMAWGPLGSGQIFGKTVDPQHLRVIETAKGIAQAHGGDWSLDQILLTWLLQHPAGILPVLGTTKIARIKGAIKALELSLSNREWFALLEAAREHEVA